MLKDTFIISRTSVGRVTAGPALSNSGQADFEL